MSNILKVITAPSQSEKVCVGCYFNHGGGDLTCHKFDDDNYNDVECYNEDRNEHLIFKLDKQE